MSTADYFGDDPVEFGAADAGGLARRQFVLSLMVGAILLAGAGVLACRAAGPEHSAMALHKVAAPAYNSAPQG